MKENELALWVARNENGNLYLFQNKPNRSTHYWFSLNMQFQINITSFPSLTWESEPIKVTLKQI